MCDNEAVLCWEVTQGFSCNLTLGPQCQGEETSIRPQKKELPGRGTGGKQTPWSRTMIRGSASLMLEVREGLFALLSVCVFMFSLFLFFVFTFVAVVVYLYVYGCFACMPGNQKPEEVTGSPRTGVTHAGNQTQFLCKSNKCS